MTDSDKHSSLLGHGINSVFTSYHFHPGLILVGKACSLPLEFILARKFLLFGLQPCLQTLVKDWHWQTLELIGTWNIQCFSLVNTFILVYYLWEGLEPTLRVYSCKPIWLMKAPALTANIILRLKWLTVANARAHCNMKYNHFHSSLLFVGKAWSLPLEFISARKFPLCGLQPCLQIFD